MQKNKNDVIFTSNYFAKPKQFSSFIFLRNMKIQEKSQQQKLLKKVLKLNY